MDLLKMFAMLEPPVMVPHPEIREHVSTGHNCARCRRYNASGKRAFWIADMWLYDATDEDVLAATLDMAKRSHKSHTGCCEACVPKIAVPRSEATPAARCDQRHPACGDPSLRVQWGRAASARSNKARALLRQHARGPLRWRRQERCRSPDRLVVLGGHHRRQDRRRRGLGRGGLPHLRDVVAP